MKLLLDQDVYFATERFLREHGHDVVTAADLDALGRRMPTSYAARTRGVSGQIAGRIREIEEEGEERRSGDNVAGVEKILSQNPYEPPTRKTKPSTKPLFHVGSKQARVALQDGHAAFLARGIGKRRQRCVAAIWKPPAGFPRAVFRRPSPSWVHRRRQEFRRRRHGISRSWNRAKGDSGRRDSGAGVDGGIGRAFLASHRAAGSRSAALIREEACASPRSAARAASKERTET